MKIAQYGSFANIDNGALPVIGDKQVREKRSSGPNKGKKYEVEWNGTKWLFVRWVDEPEMDTHDLLKQVHALCQRLNQHVVVIGKMLETLTKKQSK